MDEKTLVGLEALELNTTIDPSGLTASFTKDLSVHIENFLSPRSALALYESIAHEVEWRSFLVANGQALAAPLELHGTYPHELEKELSDCACEGAGKGFAYLYDANRLFIEDIPDGACVDDGIR
jgi:hypothetical protein